MHIRSITQVFCRPATILGLDKAADSVAQDNNGEVSNCKEPLHFRWGGTSTNFHPSQETEARTSPTERSKCAERKLHAIAKQVKYRILLTISHNAGCWQSWCHVNSLRGIIDTLDEYACCNECCQGYSGGKHLLGPTAVAMDRQRCKEKEKGVARFQHPAIGDTSGKHPGSQYMISVRNARSQSQCSAQTVACSVQPSMPTAL